MISERIRQRRTELGLKQEELAEILGVSRNTVINWEGKKRNPDSGMIVALARALQTSISFLMGEADNPAPQPPQDDIIDMSGTICNAAAGLKERGCRTVYACATHSVLSGPAMERIAKSEIEKLVFSDTIPIPESKRSEKVQQLSIAPLFAEAILRVHSDRSVSSLFDK